MHEFERVISVGEVPDPGKTLVDVEGEMVALFHVGDAWYALDDVCTHDGGPLADGELRDHKISCPRHGAKFDIRTGAALTMPAGATIGLAKLSRVLQRDSTSTKAPPAKRPPSTER